MEQLEMDFIKGFNIGYLLAKHEPDLANKLIKTPINDNEYLKGFVSGKNEHDIEKVRGLKKTVKDVTEKNKMDKERER